MELEKAVRYALEKGIELGARQLEVYGVEGRTQVLRVERAVVKPQVSVLSGLAVRAVVDGNYGFSFTYSLDEESIDRTLKSAIAIARSKGRDEYFKSLPEPRPAEPLGERYDKSVAELSPCDLIEFYDEVRSAISEQDYVVLWGAVFSSSGRVVVTNSLGLYHEERKTGFGGALRLAYLKELPPATGMSIEVSWRREDVDADRLAREALEEARKARGAKTTRFCGETTVVWSPRALSQLLWVLEREVAADSVDRGATPFTRDKVGEQVASETISVYANVRSDAYPFALERDDEGVPTRKVPIIEKGILREHVTDYYHAAKWGVEPTGNALRRSGRNALGSIESEPSPYACFLEVEGKEEEALDSILEDVREGFLVKDVMGVHMSDFSSGKFSVPAFGWYIKNGEVAYPVRNLTLSGTIPSLLSRARAVSKERKVEWELIPGNYPYVACDDITVSASPPLLKERLALGIANVLLKLGIRKSPLA